MKSLTTRKFWEGYGALPVETKQIARKQYRLWRENARHPSLQFKKVNSVWSVRVTEDYRALALYRNGDYTWFWIGAQPNTKSSPLIINSL
jgi:hypothetical protein